jgi:hypothetical protein
MALFIQPACASRVRRRMSHARPGSTELCTAVRLFAKIRTLGAALHNPRHMPGVTSTFAAPAGTSAAAVRKAASTCHPPRLEQAHLSVHTATHTDAAGRGCWSLGSPSPLLLGNSAVAAAACGQGAGGMGGLSTPPEWCSTFSCTCCLLRGSGACISAMAAAWTLRAVLRQPSSPLLLSTASSLGGGPGACCSRSRLASSGAGRGPPHLRSSSSTNLACSTVLPDLAGS